MSAVVAAVHRRSAAIPSRSRSLTAVRWILLAIALCCLGCCLAWRLGGGRWERVETPSMGTVAPVGTLLWVKPVDFNALRPGDFITFRAPGSGGVTYSHKVLDREPDGRIRTKGELSPPDPWSLGPGDVVGRVVASWRGVGTLLEALPALFGGGLVVLAMATFTAPRWRLPVCLVLGSAVISLTLAWYRPFVDAMQLTAPTPGPAPSATYVGTGLLPVVLRAPGGSSVRVAMGQEGRLSLPAPETGRTSQRVPVELRPVLPWWWWLPLLLACLAPAACAAARRQDSRHSSAHRLEPRPALSEPGGRSRKVTATTRNRHVHVTRCHSNVAGVRPRRP